MKRAIITSYTTMVPKVVASVVIENGAAVIRSDNKNLISNLSKGIYHLGLKREILPDEGENFIEALSTWGSSYLRVGLRDD